jgi:uncharacterized membrane protein YfcA
VSGLSWDVVLLLEVVCVVGAMVQSVVGLGLGLLAAPAVALVAPSLAPALPVWLALMISGVMLLGERAHVDWRALAWALPARVPGTAIGAWLVATVSDEAISVTIGVVVLLAVALTLRTAHIPLTPTTLLTAGVVSGISGTATSIGGPPLAVLYQRQPPEVVRSTLAVYFFVGVLISLIGLGLTGGLTASAAHIALVLFPAVLGGMLLGALLRDRIPREQFRLVVLGLCAVSALALLARAVL